MKKLGILIMVLTGIFSCKENNDFKVIADLEGVEDNKKVFVRKLTETNQSVVIDTLTVKDGKFTYQGTTAVPELHYFVIEEVRGSIPVILEPGEITVTADKDSLNMAVVSGTTSNDDLGELMMDYKKTGRKSNVLRMKIMKANQENDSATADALINEYMGLQGTMVDLQKEFVKTHTQSYAAVLVLRQLLSLSASGTDAVTISEIKTMYDMLPDTLKDTQEAQQIKTQLDDMDKTDVGAVAPDFSAPTPTGEILSLEAAKGKVTLIDFWAAWCKPCRIDNPELVALYNKYHDRGFTIIGVSLDKTAEDWKKAIADDHLTWNHVSNLKFWQDPIAKTYNVRAIPAKFLLDKEGKIVGKNLKGADLEAKIEELLAH